MSKPNVIVGSRKIILGISGASGAVYARRVMALLDDANCDTHVIVTETAGKILRSELAIGEISAAAIIGRGYFGDNIPR